MRIAVMTAIALGLLLPAESSTAQILAAGLVGAIGGDAISTKLDAILQELRRAAQRGEGGA